MKTLLVATEMHFSMRSNGPSQFGPRFYQSLCIVSHIAALCTDSLKTSSSHSHSTDLQGLSRAAHNSASIATGPGHSDDEDASRSGNVEETSGGILGAGDEFLALSVRVLSRYRGFMLGPSIILSAVAR